ncbi:MAG: Gfo/Idh/MocA family oxidoreductase [Planctomycetes bacterium]|nr:Gfo/Idh/MocA family oxidoreductase [Planctomycetota bacterium]MBL7144686.1 Gfo/Idh/MocA family oxidoreductase [Phycisphaerae bacterium]
MSDTIRWGIIGTGFIAHQFARGLAVLNDAKLVAVASRTKESADKFGEEFGVTGRHVGAEELAGNENVDVVYVATPNIMHKGNTLSCLNGGKAVLCEKPFCINASEAAEMVESAREKGLFLMEAMWTLCFPAMAKVREIINSGAIGEVRQVHSNFSFRCEWEPDGLLLNPELGGGSLLDVGVYNIALAQMVYQREPTRISGMAHLGETGVDEQSSVILGYDNGALAVLTSAIRTESKQEAAIYGTDGYIKIPHAFWKPERIIVKTSQDEERECKFECAGNGYNYEAAEVMRCLRNGCLESRILPLDTSVAIMRTMDTIREQWGLVYPMEKGG